MGCLTSGAVESLLIWLVVAVAIVAIIKLLLPYVLAPLGGPSAPISAILQIILWAVVAIIVIYLVFLLLGCLVGFPHRV